MLKQTSEVQSGVDPKKETTWVRIYKSKQKKKNKHNTNAHEHRKFLSKAAFLSSALLNFWTPKLMKQNEFEKQFTLGCI